jgi:hypothetical protein
LLFKDSIQVGLRVSSPSVQHFRDERIQEEELVRRFYPLKLQFDHMIAFPVAVTLRHVIDGNSPLYGMTPEDLIRSDTHLMASFPHRPLENAGRRDYGLNPGNHCSADLPGLISGRI